MHCPELMIYGLKSLPDRIDEMDMLRPSDYNIPNDGYEVLLSEGCVMPGERSVKMRVANTRVSYREIMYYRWGSKKDPREVWSFIQGTCGGDLNRVTRFFYQTTKNKNVVA